jgi:hypothetical protein
MPALKWLRLLAELQTEEHIQVTLDDRPPDWRCKAGWALLITYHPVPNIA